MVNLNLKINTKDVSDIEIFENLMRPLRGCMTEEQWMFLISRGNIFISQMSTQIKNPIKQLHYTLVNKAVEIIKSNIGKIPNELPEVLTIWAAMDVIKPYIEED